MNDAALSRLARLTEPDPALVTAVAEALALLNVPHIAGGDQHAAAVETWTPDAEVAVRAIAQAVTT
jgi:hypothetical protein